MNTELDAISNYDEPWRLSLGEQNLVAAKTGTALVHTFSREDLRRRLQLAPFHSSDPLLLLASSPLPPLRLSVDSANTLWVWLGPFDKAALQVHLRERSRFNLAVGLFLFFSSLPLPGTDLPLSVDGLVAAIALLVLNVLSRDLPHPRVLLLDVAWWVFLVVRAVYSLVVGPGVLTAGLAVIGVIFAVRAFRLYRLVSRLLVPPQIAT